MARILSYEKKDTWIHELSGVTKLLFFLVWCVVSALTYDTRILLLMIAVSLAVNAAAKTKWRQVGAVFRLIMVFMALNLAAIFIMSPYQGTAVYGTKTVLCHLLAGYDLTAEELFYLLNVLIKYFTIIPAVFTFMVTTDPSEFAASLNGIGISYSVAYSIAIALRYIPDIQDEFHRIRNAQEARGIDMSGKARLTDRIRRTSAIIFPLLFTTMERIDMVSNAMELRGFGKKKKRSWYCARPLRRNDRLVLAFTAVFAVFALWFTFRDGSRFYNPFV
ncbi:energy-coupling factor transporter transmembrane component T family protein [Lachnoclostridium sp. Marseille-P6806]|uniref:energy-coupling factor transporter transmembrane component T family protein n=1 Tax=Lachnoclostridium sp. Marseille-P6806 TaxID=2364793 RepID=UPI0010301E2E|nr:energy-coupling factor transporter transmembrane component T [Lachnoclostridium sp. Marseille-P6806]